MPSPLFNLVIDGMGGWYFFLYSLNKNINLFYISIWVILCNLNSKFECTNVVYYHVPIIHKSLQAGAEFQWKIWGWKALLFFSCYFMVMKISLKCKNINQFGGAKFKIRRAKHTQASLKLCLCLQGVLDNIFTIKFDNR